jgi:hypothetical protein
MSVHNLGKNVMYQFHASVHISRVLVFQLILCHDKFFFIVVNLCHLHSVTLSCCGCDSGLNWTFEMCSVCLNVLYLTVCVVSFLVPNVVKVLERMLNFSVLCLCIHFSPQYVLYTHFSVVCESSRMISSMLSCLQYFKCVVTNEIG